MKMKEAFAKLALSLLLLGGMPVVGEAKVALNQYTLWGSEGDQDKVFDTAGKFFDTYTLFVDAPTKSLLTWTIESQDAPGLFPPIDSFFAKISSIGPGFHAKSGGFNPWQGSVLLDGWPESLKVKFKLGGVAGVDSIYSINWNVSPVPEPEEWAMMLVGVCLVGYQVRRKQRVLNRQSMLA